MKSPLEQNYYELLEVPRDATLAEIDRAYDRARAYYGVGSAAVYTLASADEQKRVQDHIDEAYLILGDEKARSEYDARIGPPGPNERPLHRELRLAREQEAAKREAERRASVDRAAAEKAAADKVAAEKAAAEQVAAEQVAAEQVAAEQVAAEQVAAAEPSVAEPSPSEPMSANRAAPTQSDSPPPAPDAPKIDATLAAADSSGPSLERAEAPVAPPPEQSAKTPEPSPAAALDGPAPPPAMAAPEPVPPARLPAERPISVPVAAPKVEVPPADAVFSGELLRQVREGRGLTLQDIADRTKIGKPHLENIEADRYGALPAQVYLRGFLMSLARELKLDPLRVSKSYLDQVAAAPKVAGKPRS